MNAAPSLDASITPRDHGAVTRPPIELDVLVVGGGISGLLTLDALHRQGCAACLIERTALGHGQTIWSQGIIHGGLKYALGGVAGSASKAIAEMPETWRSMFRGEAMPDLSGVRLRSDDCAIWATEGASSIAGLLGAKLALQTKPTVWKNDERPEVLQLHSGRVLRVAEPVLEPLSLLTVLAERHAERLIHGNVTQMDISGEHPKVSFSIDAETHFIHADRIVITAGLGTEQLYGQLRGSTEAPPRMQQRPLRMVMARGDLPVLNGHCIRGTSPWLTITTVADTSPTIWQIGGTIAEEGSAMTAEQTIAAAINAVSTALPHVSLSGIQWATYDAPRAECATEDGGRPDRPSLTTVGPLLIGWPTKLALAPMLAADIAAAVSPAGRSHKPLDYPQPPIAIPPWEENQSWTNVHSAAQV